MPGTRARKKCSECRKKKIKCTPCDRDFETTRQECDSCKKHGLPCGPNVAKSDDPHARQKENISGNGGTEKQLLVEEAPEEIARDATSELEKLGWLIMALRHASKLSPISCNLPIEQRINHNEFPDGYVKMMESEARSIFVDICSKGQQLHKNGKNKNAHIIVLKLIVALQDYPGCCDDTMFGALEMMAKSFKDMEDTQRYEWVQEKASSIYNASKHPFNEDPCKALADSLSKSSEDAEKYLLKLFESKLMHVIRAIPPAQRAALCSNANVSKMVAASSESMKHPAPGLFNLEALHLAAARGREDILDSFLRNGAPVDDKDIHHHTALFVAAVNGHKGCCEALLGWGASPDGKDSHGTSILEVAVKGGHFEVVKLLVEAKADLNPFSVCPCTSSLLATAIKSPKLALELATYLLERGAIVDRTAIDLALENNLNELAQRMHRIQQHQDQHLELFQQAPSLSSDSIYSILGSGNIWPHAGVHEHEESANNLL